ncbi:MAG: DUF2807 domain-containing protein [Pseudomonadota bacterium]|nr:DUF2807 domain-containing protein [Pseudomonadota bacterium]
MIARMFCLGTALVLALAGEASAERFTAEDIRFENVTGAVEIVTNSGDEIDVAIRQGKTYRQVQLALENGVVVVRGEKWKEEDLHDCCNNKITRTFDPRHGRVASTGKPVDEDFFTQYPTIVVTMPRKGDATFIDARMKLKMQSLDGALNLDACYVYGEAGDAGQAVIGIIDGSRLVVGDIGSGLEIDVSGDADLRAGSAATVDVDIAGPGDVVLGDIDGMLDVSIAGSGSVRGSRLDGPLTTRIAGSGIVAIQSGRANKLKAIIDGSGAVYFDGAAVQPELKLYGSSEVHLGSVSGRIVRHGGGEVYVDKKLVPKE